MVAAHRAGRHGEQSFTRTINPVPSREIYGVEAYAPQQIADRVCTVGIAKAHLPLVTVALLGVLAGAFIGLGALMYALVTSDAGLGFVASRLLGGVAFSLGLLLVVVAGAELFTGNNLLVMAWATGQITARALLRNWAIVLATNLVGACGLVVLVWLSGHASLNHGAIAANVVQIAEAKIHMPWVPAFFRGVLCNALVCLAVWMAMGGRSVVDKAVAIVFPVTAFVAAGFEHSVANMYFLPLALLLGAPCSIALVVYSQIPVIAGNVVGGAVLVALVYWTIYVRPGAWPPSRPTDVSVTEQDDEFVESVETEDGRRRPR
jgi:formate transporter